MVNNIEDTLYLREISNLQASIKTLLEQVINSLRNIPTNNEYNSSLVKLETIQKQFDALYNRIESFIDKYEGNSTDIQNKLSSILERVGKLLRDLDFWDKDRLEKHHEEVTQLNLLLCGNSPNLIEVIKSVNDVIIKINNELQRLEIKYGETKLTTDDLQYLGEMARSWKKRRDYWTPKKKIIIWLVAGLVWIVLFFDKFSALIKILASFL